MMLRRMLLHKQYMERKFSGDLTAHEICSLLQSQTEAEETDFVTEITELKKNLLSEIRKVNSMEQEVKALDKSIALLIGVCLISWGLLFNALECTRNSAIQEEGNQAFEATSCY